MAIKLISAVRLNKYNHVTRRKYKDFIKEFWWVIAGYAFLIYEIISNLNKL